MLMKKVNIMNSAINIIHVNLINNTESGTGLTPTPGNIRGGMRCLGGMRFHFRPVTRLPWPLYLDLVNGRSVEQLQWNTSFHLMTGKTILWCKTHHIVVHSGLWDHCFYNLEFTRKDGCIFFPDILQLSSFWEGAVLTFFKKMVSSWPCK